MANETTGKGKWVKYGDRFNLTRPELSPILLAPLAKEAGGWGMCAAKGKQEVFRDKQDPDYLQMLSVIKQGKPRVLYYMKGYQPHPLYIEVMKKYGVLPVGFDINKDPLDIFETDRKYFELFTPAVAPDPHKKLAGP